MVLPKNAQKLTGKNVQVPYNCQFIVAQESEAGFEIYEIFQVKNDLEIIYQKVGDWDSVSGISTQCCEGSIDRYIYNRRKKYLSGTELMARASSGTVSIKELFKS